MRKRVNKIKEKKIHTVLHGLETVNDDHKMLKPVKKLHEKPFENPAIYNEKGKIVTNSQEVHKIIQKYFKNLFHKEDVTEIEKRIGEPKPLFPITTAEEIAKVLTKMSNPLVKTISQSNSVKTHPSLHIKKFQ